MFWIAVPPNYIIQQNVSALFVTEASSGLSGTVRAPFAVTVDRDFFGSGFLETADSGTIAIFTFTPGFTFSATGGTFVTYTSVAEVEVVTSDPVRGTAYVVRPVLVYSYSLPSPLTGPMEVEFVINANIERTITESRTPFITGSITLVPPGK